MKHRNVKAGAVNQLMQETEQFADLSAQINFVFRLCKVIEATSSSYERTV